MSTTHELGTTQKLSRVQPKGQNQVQPGELFEVQLQKEKSPLNGRYKPLAFGQKSRGICQPNNQEIESSLSHETAVPHTFWTAAFHSDPIFLHKS